MFWKISCIIAVCLCCFKTEAQPSNTNQSIDTLINSLPSLMRSDEKLARISLDKLTEKSKALQHQHGIIQSLFFKAWLSYRHQPAEIVIKSIDSVLSHVKGIEKDTALVKFYILKGQCFVKKAQFENALQNFKTALKIAEQRKDHLNQTGTLISIGWAYMEDGKPKEAIHFFNEVLLLNPDPNYENKALVLCNIASCYNTILNFKQAEGYALKGIAAARKMERNTDLANGLNILARSYYQQGSIDKAIPILKEAAKVREKVADPSMLASDYIELADIYSKTNKPEEAIKWAKKAEAISIQYSISLKQSNAYQSLSDAYMSIGDYKNAYLYLNKLLIQKDSLSESLYNKAFAQMQVQYETQKKTSENLQLKKENLETKLKNSNQQIWLIVLAAVMLLLIASVFYISKLWKSRYATRLALEQLNEQKRQTMAVMKAEEKERKRIAGELHDSVCQVLAAASLQLNKLRNGQTSVDKVDELIQLAGTEVRNLSHQVTPQLLIHYGLVKVIEQAVDRLNDAQDHTTFSLFTYIEKSEVDEMISLTIYRCFQELCTNILKHAKASKVIVELNLHQDEVQLMIEDNGIGFDLLKTEHGLGLKNIESRISLFDGKIIMDSTPGKGTTTIVKVSSYKIVESINKTI